MAPVVKVASDVIIYNTVHGRIIVYPGETYTVDTALAPGKQFVSCVKTQPPREYASTLTQ